jgi:hypothetical protein
VVACVATALVAAEAWPVRVSVRSADGPTPHAAGHLRAGIALTFVAVGLTALATASSWWPADAGDAGLVTVSTAAGLLCGQLLCRAAASPSRSSRSPGSSRSPAARADTRVVGQPGFPEQEGPERVKSFKSRVPTPIGLLMGWSRRVPAVG